MLFFLVVTFHRVQGLPGLLVRRSLECTDTGRIARRSLFVTLVAFFTGFLYDRAAREQHPDSAAEVLVTESVRTCSYYSSSQAQMQQL